MDLASILGIVLGIVMFIYGILSNKANLQYYWDYPSFIITILGSMTGVLSAFKMPEFLNGLKAITLIFKNEVMDPSVTIGNIINLSNVARKEGLLALEEAANGIEDPFLKKGVMLIVDGTDPELVRGILETELSCLEDRHKKVIGFWDKWAELGPAWGMIGTLIGLVNMLYNMDDAASIGPSMAVALITTLYGSLVANWLCIPVSSKMKVNNDLEMMMKDVTVEGLLSIQAGENPRVIEEKLKSFLSPKVRDALGGDNGGGEE